MGQITLKQHHDPWGGGFSSVCVWGVKFILGLGHFQNPSFILGILNIHKSRGQQSPFTIHHRWKVVGRSGYFWGGARPNT